MSGKQIQQSPRLSSTPEVTCVVLTADKGVAMVVMDKGSYI